MYPREVLDLQNKLAELRKERHLSQKEFSKIFNVAQNTISQWEQGKRNMDTEILLKLADNADSGDTFHLVLHALEGDILALELFQNAGNALDPPAHLFDRGMHIPFSVILNNMLKFYYQFLHRKVIRHQNGTP